MLLVTQASQVLLLSLSVWVFFLSFGRVAIDESVVTTWVGNGAPHYPLLLGRLGVSRELLQVSIFLSAFSGLYFTVYAVTDSTYRDQFFHEITDELERAVGVRAAYLALRRVARGSRPMVAAMEHRTLGSSGAVVSTYALGTMTFGTETDEEGSHEQLDVFLEAGGTLVDTADVYTAGASEEIIGRWLDDRPSDVTDRVVLATKARFAMGDDPNDAGLSRRHLTRALDASLTRLRVETASTSTRCTPGTRSPRSRRPSASSTTPSAPERSAMRGCRTSPAGRCSGPSASRSARGLAAAGHPAAAVQPAGPRDRVGDRPGLPGERARPAALVAARRRLADRQVHPGPAPQRGDPAGRGPGARRGGLRQAGRRRADLGGGGGGPVGRRGPRGVRWRRSPSPGCTTGPAVTSVILGARTTEQLTRRTWPPRACTSSPEETARLDAASDPAPADYPYGRPGDQAA